MDPRAASQLGESSRVAPSWSRSSNAVVGVYREHFGKGPSSAKTPSTTSSSVSCATG